MKNNAEYAGIYQKMVQGRGTFTFWIECYHLITTTSRNRNGNLNTHTRKVVTHTATEVFVPTQCTDESGDLSSIVDVKPLTFIHYLKRFYFTDDQSQYRFMSAFNNFVARNRRDIYQSYTHTFNIDGYE